MSDENNAQTIAALAAAAGGKPQIIDDQHGGTHLLYPDGDGSYTHFDITPRNAMSVYEPKKVSQNVAIQTTDSLVDYVNRFKNADTTVFADITQDTLEAIIDYHRQPEANSVATEDLAGNPLYTDPTARLCSHHATLKLPFSLEWQTWTEMSGKLMSQVSFATFLEENAIDVAEPAGASLLEVCRDLQVRSGVNWNSSVRMGDVVNLEYQKGDDVSTKDNIQLPTQIKLLIPVYFNEPAVEITAYMRRKVDDGSLMLGYVMSRAEQARQTEFHRIVGNVTDALENVTMIYGRPA